MSGAPDDVQVLQASVAADDESHFRLLLRGRHIRYVTVAAGVYEGDDMCFPPSLLSILPRFPAGDWNDGYITKHSDSGDPYFKSAVRTQFPAIQSAWHRKYFDYLDLELGEKLRTNLYEAKTSGFPEAVVVAKFARFGWEIDYMDTECAAYQWIQGKDIGPKFLGNISEEGRTIGFIIERIVDAHHASTADYAACKAVLSRLHHLGILHGDINKHNFLVSGDTAVLIDFDCARKTEDKAALAEEMSTLQAQLASTSGLGGSSSDR
ncbi:kinase-like domain [Lecanosticta acicola]|uniref:Kinase-like domain n=1 Tax=Lecanosticta acicola TaxID=111012 RepID=A0AAI8Z3K5_9PEZI|nr:kinase-like domain [Lecanosticta acicola]